MPASGEAGGRGEKAAVSNPQDFPYKKLDPGRGEESPSGILDTRSQSQNDRPNASAR